MQLRERIDEGALINKLKKGYALEIQGVQYE